MLSVNSSPRKNTLKKLASQILVRDYQQYRSLLEITECSLTLSRADKIISQEPGNKNIKPVFKQFLCVK